MNDLSELSTNELHQRAEELRKQIEIREIHEEAAREFLNKTSMSIDDAINILRDIKITPPAPEPAKTQQISGEPIVKQYHFMMDGMMCHMSTQKIPKKIMDTKEFQALPEGFKNPDSFLRKYSTQYCADYPVNARYGDVEWYMNPRGRQNERTKELYLQYCNDNNVPLHLRDGEDSRSNFRNKVLLSLA